MPLFKSLKAPTATASIEITKDNFAMGETITGNVTVTSDDEFEAKEIRVELHGWEKLKEVNGIYEGDEEGESPLTRLYSSGEPSGSSDAMGFPMYEDQTIVAGRTNITKGFNQRFPFRITVPTHLGPSFQGTRHDGHWLERTWTLKSVVAVGGRPDVKAERLIQVSVAANPPGIFPSQPA